VTTASEALAQWSVGFRLDDAPLDARNASRKALFNTVATGIGGVTVDHTRRALSLARSDGQAGPAHVIGEGDALPVSLAGFVNGVVVNALGQEETHVPSGTHPAETTAPIALAEAEAVGATGRDLLEAFIVGLQVSGAVGAMGLVWQGRELLAQPPSAFGAIGAAAAAAKLRGLDQEQTAHALELAAMFAAAPAESMRQGTGEYHYLKGMIAVHAHSAVMLALAGAPAATTALEGPAGFYRIWGNIPSAELEAFDVAGDVASIVAERWVAPELIFKRYPVNYFNQPFIDSARVLRERHGIDASEIRGIRMTLGAHPAKVGGLGTVPFERRSSAMMSTRFGVSCMLARGRVTLEDTLSPGGDDIRRLCEIAQVDVDASSDDTVFLEIKTSRGTFGGDMLSEFNDYRIPMPDIERIAAPIVAARLGTSRQEKLFDLLANVESVPSVTELLAATTPASA